MEPEAMSAHEPAEDGRPVAHEPQGRVVAPLLSSAKRTRLGAAARTGSLARVGEVDLLQPARLPQLARASLWLFLAAGAGFVALDLTARRAQQAGPLLGSGPLPLRLLVLAVANLAAYAVMIAAHELLHAAAILALGGRSRFGLKLPLAAYCTAPGQLFTPVGYMFIALTPLVALTIAGVLITWYFPDLGALLWLALVGNISGAAGDLEAVSQLRAMPRATLIADTATGFVAYALPTSDHG
jgi:hypothetical protein